MDTKIVNNFLQTRIKNKQNDYIHPSYELERQLINAITSGKINESLKVLNKINLLERPKLSKDDIRSLKNSLICSCTLFTRAIINGNVHPEIAFNLSDVYILQIEETNNKHDLELLEYSMIKAFIQTLIDEKQPQYSRIVNDAILFIKDNILHELSLDIIAEHVFVHSSYLSTLFKREVGIGITQFINKKRIEESKYFLLHTKTSISEIAFLFKFCNQSYYTVLFKTYFGVTPNEYRSQYGGGGTTIEESI